MAVLLVTNFGFAQAQTFIGGGGNEFWSNSSNWAEGVVPTAESENVAINANVVVDVDVTVVSLYDAAVCDMTVQSGKKLCVSGEMVWNKGGNFLLEDGAQLIADSQVAGVLEKRIVAHNQDEETLRYFIASPIVENVVPSIENGFLTDPATGYVLLAFNEQSHDWIDFKENSFPLVNGKGYLYANALDTILLYAGTLRNSDIPYEVGLDFHSSNGTLAGCNVVGNPFPCDAFLNRSYYLLNETGTTLLPVTASSATPLAPCMGCFVKANGTGEKATFSRVSSQTEHNQGVVEISVVKPNAPDAILDQAIVSFNAGDKLGKIAYNQENPNLYFTEGSKNYAIISIDSADMIPVRFIAAEDASYKLKVTYNDLSSNYLHLIDNMTGANIDLLTQPEYIFTAEENSGYTSRFKLVFDPHYGLEEDVPSTGSGTFAYYSNGQIRISEMQPSASIQLIDITGRVVYCGEATETISTFGMVPGLYVLRMTSGNAVRTQKIVVQ